ncbi:hypothetical protein TraAM80_02728 [Trypanosoma rangeli]|uniref:Uncharacterized protein n=1 Tax=Trypanosoma rangeli TaxID=5698 RepID=A0A3R7KRY7_TRYRA|nr:uncharacterized protein TraAM80_02728 [Trypanosoma rangeli]RNF08502.1 hypothetical protein TraAM80_02728 [Trypanosoma rangeli]|eukprot:RNF08502.1 hypothetical protein TraAM80_02728 [Trypanosoma rangeli]
MHPVIAELKRRNRVAGQRLTPIDARATNITPKPPSHQRTSVPARPTASTVRLYSSAQDTQSHASSRFVSTAKLEGGRGSHTISTTNLSASKARCDSAKPLMHRTPAKPQSAGIQVRSKNNAVQEKNSSLREKGSSLPGSDTASQGIGIQKIARNSMVSQGSLFEGISLLWDHASGAGIAKSTTSYAAITGANEEKEVVFLEKYKNSETWNHNLSQQILDVLQGDRMEDPFTTDLWARPLKGVAKNFSGYYACIRCHVPLVAPTYQILYLVRGIAAFSRMNTQAVEVRVGSIAAPISSSAQKSGLLELQVHCQCCGGFLGILAPCTEIELAAGARSVFVVNSCCLEFVESTRTPCRLDGIYGEDEEDLTGGITAKASRGSIEINFDDPSIFEM